jgi:hypothetical protein
MFIIVKDFIGQSESEIVDSTPLSMTEAVSLTDRMNGALMPIEDQLAYDGVAIQYTYQPII